jgi:hypothetical protein
MLSVFQAHNQTARVSGSACVLAEKTWFSAVKVCHLEPRLESERGVGDFARGGDDLGGIGEIQDKVTRMKTSNEQRVKANATLPSAIMRRADMRTTGDVCVMGWSSSPG